MEKKESHETNEPYYEKKKEIRISRRRKIKINGRYFTMIIIIMMLTDFTFITLLNIY